MEIDPLAFFETSQKLISVSDNKFANRLKVIAKSLGICTTIDNLLFPFRIGKATIIVEHYLTKHDSKQHVDFTIRSHYCTKWFIILERNYKSKSVETMLASEKYYSDFEKLVSTSLSSEFGHVASIIQDYFWQHFFILL